MFPLAHKKRKGRKKKLVTVVKRGKQVKLVGNLICKGLLIGHFHILLPFVIYIFYLL